MKHNFGMEMRLSRFFTKTLILACVVAASTPAVALEPPAKGELKRLAIEGKLDESMRFARELGNYKTSPQVIARFKYKFQRLLLEKKGLSPAEIDEIMAPPPAWEGMPTTGNVKVLTLLIDFSDTPHLAADTVEAVTAKIFGDGLGGAPYESLRNFYRRASYNLLEIGGNALGWYTTAYPRSSVVQNYIGREALIKEALNYYNGLGHDFSQYDNDGDGAIDYLAVVWAGTHGAWASFWWGYQTSFSDPAYLLDGKRLSKYSWQWESYSYPSGSFSPNVLIHETGHALGLPDLYDYDDSIGPMGGVGGLDQMDSNWGDHNAFSKWMMEWLTPTAVSSGAQTVDLAPTGTSPQAAIFMPDASSSQSFAEFFVVQNRYRTGNDIGYPTNGLLIWHVDARLQGGDFLYDNSYTDHKLVRLMEADGLEEIEDNGSADAGDYYPQGGLFGPGTTPASISYNGLPTGMGVRAITAPGLSQSCEIYRLEDSTPPTGAPSAPLDEGTTIGRTRLIFTWTQGSAADPDSGIAGYNLRVGTSPGGNSLFQGGVGNVTTYAVTGAVNGSTYYASVQAVNGVGMGGDWSPSSDGIQVVLPTLAEALDTTGLTWSTSGSAAWFGQTGTSHDGTDAAQSPSLGNNQSASFQATVTGPGTLTFYWKVSSELDYDYLTFFLDGSEQFKISGEVNWALNNIAIPAGSHVARWTYSKDQSVAGGQDLAWVDQVVAPTGGTNPTISGTILAGGLPLAGVALSGLTGDPVTNASGDYSGTVASGWSGTVTPTLAGYTFSPVNRVYINVTVNQTAQDFTATLAETVSAPTTPSGPSTGLISTSYDYATGGSTSSLGHAVQYKFDWDDGSDSGWLAVGTTQASHSWAAAGTYNVRAMACCAEHTTVESIWSTTLSVIITDGSIAGEYNSPAQYKVLPEAIWANASGGGTWMSNVQVTDVTGGSRVSVYYNTGTERRGPFLLWDNSAGNDLSSQKYDNLLETIDGLDTEAFTYYGTVGAVEFVTQDGSHLVQAAARTLNGNYAKTFTAVSLHDCNTAEVSRAMIIPNLTNNGTYRSSCGFFNPTDAAVTMELRLRNAANAQVGSTVSKTLAGHEFIAYPIFNEAGISYPGTSSDNIVLQVIPTSGSGKVVCFGASANNTSNDPAAHVAVQNAYGYDNGPSFCPTLPEAVWAPASGGGTWVSEVQIVDVTGGSQVSVYFDYGGGSRRGPFVLWTGSAAGAKVKYGNLLEAIDGLDSEVFTYYGKGGAVEFRTQDSAHFIQVTARTLNGDYSKTFPGLNGVEAETADTSQVMLIQNYTNNSTYRSTCGFFNPTAEAVTVEFTLLNGSGAQIGSKFSKTLVGYDFKSFNPFLEAGVPYPTNSYDNVILGVQPTSGTGKVVCFGASANNASNDPASHLAVQGQ